MLQSIAFFKPASTLEKYDSNFLNSLVLFHIVPIRSWGVFARVVVSRPHNGLFLRRLGRQLSIFKVEIIISFFIKIAAPMLKGHKVSGSALKMFAWALLPDVIFSRFSVQDFQSIQRNIHFFGYSNGIEPFGYNQLSTVWKTGGNSDSVRITATELFRI